MLFIISVTLATVIVPMVTGGYNYQVPSRILEQPSIQPPYSYGQLRVQNVLARNVQPINSYQNNVYAQDIRNTANAQQPIQTLFNYQVQPNQIFPPLPYTEQRRIVFPVAIGVQPPNIRNVIHPVIQQSNREPASPAVIQSQTITSNQVPYHTHTGGPVFYGYQPVVPQAPYIPPQTIQQPNQAITSQVVNQQIVQQQQQYNNVEVSQEQVYINNNEAPQDDEETVVEEEISYPQNFVNENTNQQSNVKLSNSVTINNIVGGNSNQNNVVNPVSVSYDTSVPAVATPQTIITKHVYFHAPPPDLEEAPIVNTIMQPAKKTFNIIFIKVPSQEYLNRAQILKQLQGRQNSVDKTLIYVLVKKQDSPLAPILGQNAQPSKPEVFFVKYKDDHREAVPTLASSTSSIRQDLVHSHA